MPRGVVFRGRVVPKAGDVWRGAYAYHDAATAQVRQRVVTVAPDGSFDIPSVRPGHGVVYLWSQDGRYALLRDPAESAERVTLQTHVGQTISGRIERDKADAPSSLSVSAMWDGPVVWRPADGAGRFVLPALPPGTYGLRWHAGAATGVFEMPARVPAGAKDVKVRLPR